jgi:hypothetical protein
MDYKNEPWMWITTMHALLSLWFDIMVYENCIHDLLESMPLNKIY